MDFDLIYDRISSMNFRQSVWLFPLAYFLHVLEEFPPFTNLARRYAAPGFTMRDYLTIHVIVITNSTLAIAFGVLVFMIRNLKVRDELS